MEKHLSDGDTLLEVAIGTGYPFADYFSKKGYTVYGVDISPELIEKCKKLYPNIKSKVGDAEDLEYPDNFFDGTYCFDSTWYFPNLKMAIDNMLQVTKPGGSVIFDIQNRNKKEIEKAYKRRLNDTTGIGIVKTYIKNIAKLILRRGTPDWHLIIHETPTLPEDVCQYLKDLGFPYVFHILVRKQDDSLEMEDSSDPSFLQYDRLIFHVLKQ